MSTAAGHPSGPGVLSHLRVLDLSQLVAGPYASKLLADLGADVVKVEPPAGDVARRFGPFPGGAPNGDAGALFLYLNVNKRSIRLDLGTRQGRALLLRLLPRFDVLLMATPPGAPGDGIDRAALLAANPDLIIVRISPFGQSGPYSQYRATDLILQAASGIAHHNGESDREPLQLFGWQAYYLGGVHASVALMAALRRRRLTGEAQEVDLSIMESATNIIVPTHTSFSYDEQVTIRRGGGRGTFAVYPCADGAVTISVYHTGREWDDFVEMVEIDALRDAKFSSAGGRIEHIEELEASVMSWTLARTRQELMEIGRQHRIAVGMEMTVEDLLASDHLRERQFFTPVQHPLAGTVQHPGPPARWSTPTWAIRRPAPLLGQHTAEVLGGELGLSVQQLRQLDTLGVT